MATDPVQSIQTHESDTPLELDLGSVIRRLAALQPSPVTPYLTVCLDWTPDGSSPGRAPREEPLRSQRHVSADEPGPARRPSRQQFQRDITEVLARYGPHGEAFDSLSADVELIQTYLDNELDPAARGVVIVACHARDVFEPVALSMAVPVRIDVGPIPALSTLAQVHDDHPTYAVILADQKNATLAVVSLGVVDRSVAIEGTGFPRKQQQGGWSQKRYQMRADERSSAFLRTVADRARQIVEDEGISLVILAGAEDNTSALLEELHDIVKGRVIGSIRMDIRASESDLIDATLPLIEKAERRRERELVQTLADGLGSGGLAASNIDDTLAALQLGQVDTLVIADDMHAAGWADFDLNVFGSGFTPSQHPTGGNTDSLVQDSLEQELIRLALTTDADIEIVQTVSTLSAADLDEVPEAGEELPRSEAARHLDNFGSVGALLRFSMEETLPHADGVDSAG